MTQRTIKTCSIDGCKKPVHSRQRCNSHYYQWKLENNPPCLIEGCNSTSLARELCPPHYRKWQRGELKELPREDAPICSVEGCGKPQHSKDYCSSHKHRKARYGDPLAGGGYRLHTPEEAFLSRIAKRANGCIEWTGADTGMGYGNMRTGGTWVLAHRYSWERENGPIPEGMVIDHKCHNPRCVNVKHLRVVTHKQNLENHSGPTRISRSGVRGVHWSKASKKWCVQVTHNGETFNGGVYEYIEDAEQAAIALRNDLHTHNDLDRVA